MSFFWCGNHKYDKGWSNDQRYFLFISDNNDFEVYYMNEVNIINYIG